jgi:ABC-type glycerol-3-phosphate transport system permease component
MLTLTTYQRRVLNEAGWQFLRYLVVIVLSVFFIVPFFWMLSTSLKDSGQAYTFPPQFIPQPVTFDNYRALWGGQLPFDRFYVNTTIIVIFVEIGTLISCTLVAFSFARLQWHGRNFWFVVLVATLMMPFHVVMIPIYIIFRLLGWLDTFLPLIVPAFFGNAFYIFLLRQYFMTLPKDLEDAARVDGANTFRILWQIFLPLSKPVLLTVSMFAFVGTWNDFLGPLLYLTSLEKLTISVGLSIYQGRRSPNWPGLMAGATLAMLPILVLFLLFQRYFVKGIVLTGMKG